MGGGWPRQAEDWRLRVPPAQDSELYRDGGRPAQLCNYCRAGIIRESASARAAPEGPQRRVCSASSRFQQ
eukprot:5704584-Alexandrium_andersonii.AAC.1